MKKVVSMPDRRNVLENATKQAAPMAITATLAFSLAILPGCEDQNTVMGMYANVEQCVTAGLYSRSTCEEASGNAARVAEGRPGYTSREACEEDWGAAQCQPRQTAVEATPVAQTTETSPTTAAAASTAASRPSGGSTFVYIPHYYPYYGGGFGVSSSSQSVPLYGGRSSAPVSAGVATSYRLPTGEAVMAGSRAGTGVVPRASFDLARTASPVAPPVAASSYRSATAGAPRVGIVGGRGASVGMSAGG